MTRQSFINQQIMSIKLLLKTIPSVVLALYSMIAPAQENVIRLYEGAAPGSEKWTQKETTIEYQSPFWNEKNLVVLNVVDPTLTVFLPAPEKANGSAIIICPGGGFSALSWDNEGPNVAKWLADNGVAAFVLKYRIAYAGATPEEVNLIAMTSYGGQPRTPEVMELIKKNCEITLSMSGTDPQGNPEADDPFTRSLGNITKMAVDDARHAIEYVRSNADRWKVNPDKIGMIGFSAGGMLALDVAVNHTDLSKPDFIGIIYGAFGYKGVPDDPMPMFMAATQYEATGNAASIYADWCKAKMPAEIHSFTDSRHGFGYRENGDTVNTWIELLYNFMKKTGFIN
jgi:acetyl esterase/lipase